MKIHSDILTEETIAQALRRCQDDGRVSESVQFDPLVSRGSTKRARGFEVQLGCSVGDSWRPDWLLSYGYGDKAVRAAGIRRHRQGKVAGEHLSRCATWHEWGHFIAELFLMDPRAIVGTYDGWDAFDYQTGPDEMPYQRLEWVNEQTGRVYGFMRHAMSASEARERTASNA